MGGAALARGFPTRQGRSAVGLGYLVHHVDAVGQLLALQEGVQVVQQQTQVLLPGAVRHDDGCAGPGLTPCGAVPAPWFHSGVPLHNVCQ